MGVQLKPRLTGIEEVGKFLARVNKRGQKAMETGLIEAGNLIEAEMKENLGGKVLNQVSSNLQSQVFSRPDPRAGAKTVVKIGTPVIYGAVHETGGTVVNGWGRGITIVIPKRPWAAPALESARPTILKVIRRAVFAAVGRTV